jgi:O-antigen/teichoic acid export membrane protein
MSNLDKIASGASIVFIGMVISKLLSYIYRLIIARVGVSEYGLFSLGLGIIGIIIGISLFGLQRGVLRYVSYYRGKEDLRSVKGAITYSLKTSFMISFILSILLFLLSDFIALNYFDNIDLSLILKILAIVIPINVVNEVSLHAILGFQKIRYIIISKNIILNLVKVSLTLILLYFSINIIGIAIVYVISFLVSLIFSLYFLERKVFPIIKSKIRSIYVGKEIFSFSWPLVFSSFAMLIMGWSDTMMIGFFKTVKEVGLYNTALPTAQILYTVPQGLAFLVVPTLTYLFSKKDMNEFKTVYKSTTKWVFMLNIILFSIFVLFPKEIITILFGTEYSIAAPALVILSMGLFLNYSFILTNYIPTVANRTKLELLNISSGAILNIILNIILIPKYGIMGAAVATSISFLLTSILYFIEGLWIIKINPLKFNYLKIIISILITSLLIKYISQNFINVDNIINLLIISILFVILYFVLLILTRSFEKEDKNILSKIMRKTGLKIQFIERFL